MSIQWTKEQQKVIKLRDRNILVSAAAGSGKTAVLVERIIQRLMGENPIDVDRLLIVTFTEAAAAEMKERIRDAITQQLVNQPDQIHLQRQATLIHQAQIMTIHSFCLSVIREHFHRIELDPGFRIAEEGELKLLKRDVLQEVLEKKYEEQEDSFLNFIEGFVTGRDDKKVEEMILQLYEASRSNPEPEKWLEECIQMYDISDEDGTKEPQFVQSILEDVRSYLEDVMKLVQQGLTMCDALEGPYMYRDALEQDEQEISELQKSDSYATFYQKLQLFSQEGLKANRDKAVSLELAQCVKDIHGQVKKTVDDFKNQYFYQEPGQMWLDMEQSKPFLEVLVELVIEFTQTFEQTKRRKNVIDFEDMEQYALRILTKRVEGGLEPSQAAEEYQKQFLEIMIDEYQDSNLLQDTILTSVSTVHKGIPNLFMVGDVKQSIYRFRLSRPELFMDKYNHYSMEDSPEQRIILGKNFRSRREVLDSVNFIFTQIMTQRLGNIVYDSEAALYVGTEYEPQPGNETEVLLVHEDSIKNSLINKDINIEDTTRELEARAVARRIKELLDTHQILDKKRGIYRKIRCKDIVVLTRSIKGWTNVFAKILNQEGIPTFTGTKEGYFQTMEISLILDYLSVLDNRKQDIPLAAVLTSPLVGLSGEELAKIKSYYKKLPFYEAVQRYAIEGEEQRIMDILQACFEKMESFRVRVPYTAIHELLWKIIDETGYGAYVSALPGGEQRQANLDMLIERAIAFESTSYKGLFNFVRYMEQLQKYQVDYGEASIEDERADAVHLMSIHKSKGLEFPVVIVAGMGKRFNQQDIKGSVVIHPELGVGIDAVDLENRTKIPTLLKKVIQKKVQYENLGEELRVLYVAFTRAKEKLIMVGTVSNFEKKLQGMAPIWSQEEIPLTFSRLTKATCYFDWVLPALIRHSSFAATLATYGIAAPFTNPLYHNEMAMRVESIYLEDLVKKEMVEEAQGKLTKDILQTWDTTCTYDANIKRQLEQQFTYEYPYQDKNFKRKFTVSELKKRPNLKEEAGEVIYGEPEMLPIIPKFLQQEEELHGASRGSAYHKLMELLDFTHSYDKSSLEDTMECLIQSNRMSKTMGACIQREDILELLNSTLGRRMQNAGEHQALFVEQPFVLGMNIQEVYPEETSQEMVLVQGIIDVYFEENGELVVLDYKTDHVKTEQELVDRYHAQLDYYAKALTKLTQKPVKEKLIYSFALHQTIVV
ncbi:MAG: helicase-exonuclease AddAB subunit AddA [Lachnospiraceae bacterium]